MAFHVCLSYYSGASLGLSIERVADGLLYDYADSTYKATPTTLISALTAGTGNFVGRYMLTLASTPVGTWPDGDYRANIHDMANSNLVIAVANNVMHGGDDATIIAGSGADLATLLARTPALGIVGTVNDVAATATQFNVSVVAPRSLVGRYLAFTSGINQSYAAHVLTDTGTGTTPRTLTVSAGAFAAPGNGDAWTVLGP